MATNEHTDMLQWLSRSLDGELGDAEEILLQDHLEECPTCAARARELRAIERALRSHRRTRSPVGLVDRIVAHAMSGAPLDAARGEAEGLAPVRWLKRSAALAAAALVVCATIHVARLPKEAYAAGEPPQARRDSPIERLLERWAGLRTAPSYFELVLARDPSGGGR